MDCTPDSESAAERLSDAALGCLRAQSLAELGLAELGLAELGLIVLDEAASNTPGAASTPLRWTLLRWIRRRSSYEASAEEEEAEEEEEEEAEEAEEEAAAEEAAAEEEEEEEEEEALPPPGPCASISPRQTGGATASIHVPLHLGSHASLAEWHQPLPSLPQPQHELMPFPPQQPEGVGASGVDLRSAGTSGSGAGACSPTG
jgi:hypothetical protein